MKIKVLLVTLLILIMNLSCGGKNTVKEIKIDEVVKNINNSKYVFVDNREDSLFNGFKDKDTKRGGHIKGAVQFNCDLFDYIEEDKFESYVGAKGITKDKTVVFYGTDRETLNCISGEFAARGYNVKIFDGFKEYANDEKNPMESFPNFEYSVSPEWVNEVIQGKKPETYNNDKYMIFEVSWGPIESAETYNKEHIPGSYHFNTDWVENGPIWNLSDPKVVEKNLLAAGITADKTIILYSDTQLAAYRVFLALKWMGVKDVRVLNGNLSTWKDKGFTVENKVNTPIVETNFGIENIPAHPEYIVAMPDDAIKMQKEGLKLISNRSWEEYTGQISGYDYIPGKGEPAGAIWGFAGTDSSNVADYYDPDGTLRNPNEIFELWKGQNILKGDKLAFYCGTGWRASIPWFMTIMAGWENTYVYDGGWNAWQMEPGKYPVQVGAPNNMQKPDSKNNFGKIEKKANATCRG